EIKTALGFTWTKLQRWKCNYLQVSLKDEDNLFQIVSWVLVNLPPPYTNNSGILECLLLLAIFTRKLTSGLRKTCKDIQEAVKENESTDMSLVEDSTTTEQMASFSDPSREAPGESQTNRRNKNTKKFYGRYSAQKESLHHGGSGGSGNPLDGRWYRDQRKTYYSYPQMKSILHVLKLSELFNSSIECG
ncbi:hypothetical protein L9F63_001221, partial [Diploptera punctata]